MITSLHSRGNHYFLDFERLEATFIFGQTRRKSSTSLYRTMLLSMTIIRVLGIQKIENQPNR